MNPIVKCCGYYCAFIMTIALYFFTVLIILEATHSDYMNKLQEGQDSKDYITAMGIALGVSTTLVLITNRLTLPALLVASLVSNAKTSSQSRTTKRKRNLSQTTEHERLYQLINI